MQLLAGGDRGERSGFQPHVVVCAVEAAGEGPVVLVADLLGDVLLERAAERHVQQLHPAADPENRHVPLDCSLGDRQLRSVALGHGAVRRGMRVGAVRGGIDVVAAGEDQPVDQLEYLIGVLLELLVGGNHQRKPAGALDRGDVAVRQQRRALIPEAPLRPREARADADDRSWIHRL